MKKKKKSSLPARYVLLFMLLFCILLLVANYFKPGFLSPVSNAVNAVLTPMQ